MAQYIPHPALQGMEMGNRASLQRMNIYGQAIAQAVDALNKQAAADAQAEIDLLAKIGAMQSGINTVTGLPQTYKAPELEAYKAALTQLQRRKFGRAAIDPTQPVDLPERYVGVPTSPSAETPPALTGGMIAKEGWSPTLSTGKALSQMWQQYLNQQQPQAQQQPDLQERVPSFINKLLNAR